MNIILIDDSDLDNKVNKKLLTSARISDNIEVFDNAQTSLDFIVKNSTDWTSRRVILLDLSMPNMNGLDWLAEYNSMPIAVKTKCIVFILSASVDRTELNLVESNPSVIALLEKPLDVYLLKQLLKEESIKSISQ